MEQRTDYSLLVAELKKRFIPVALPAIQSNLFPDKKQDVSESVDAYAQELRTLFHKAYPSVQQGTREAEALGQTILTNQFVVGLLPDIKSKIVGSEIISTSCFQRQSLKRPNYVKSVLFDHHHT